MNEWTGIEVERTRQALEEAGAKVLGRMLFEFSRLDMALGLAIVWSNEGAQLDELTTQVDKLQFNDKLERLLKLVKAKYASVADHEAGAVYSKWVDDVHEVRMVRNELVHGRWGIDHMKNQVVNVHGLPTSPDQKSTGYSINELKAVLEHMVQLQVRLVELRARWPV